MVLSLSFVDASNVYGSDETRAKALRTMENGELKTSQNGLNLPYNLDRLANAGGDQNTSFVAGKEILATANSNVVACVCAAHVSLFLVLC